VIQKAKPIKIRTAMMINKIFYYFLLCVPSMSVVIKGSDENQAITTTNSGAVGRVESVHADVLDVEKLTYGDPDWAQVLSKADPHTLDAYYQRKIKIIGEIFELNKVSSEAVDIVHKVEDLVCKLKYTDFFILKDIRKSLKDTHSEHPKTGLLDIDHLFDNDPTPLLQEDITGNSLEYRTGPSFTYMGDDLGWCLIMVTIQSAINANTAKLIDPEDISTSSERLERYQTMLGQLHASIAPVVKVRNIGSGNNYDEAKTSPQLNLIIRGKTLNQVHENVDRIVAQKITPLGEFFANPDSISVTKNFDLIEKLYEYQPFRVVVGSIIFDTLLLVSIYGCQGQKPTEAMTHLLNSVPKVLYYLNARHPKPNDKDVLQAVLHGFGDYLQTIDAGDVARDWFTKLSEWAKQLRKIEGLAKALESRRSVSVTQN
jgi:hypothetical protein